MSPHPIRLIVSGYGLAAAGAAALAFAGGPLWVAGLAFWLGGAVATLALAGAPGVGRLFRRDAESDRRLEEQALEAALARWEADRLADSAEAARAAERERSAG